LCADYSPSYLTEKDVRNFFSPPLDNDDIPKAEILLKIEVVEDYIDAVYELASSTDARIPALLLVAAKIIQNPVLARKHYTLSEEQLGDYRYVIAPTMRAGAITNPFALSTTWESIAVDMLRARSAKKSYKWKVYISNS